MTSKRSKGSAKPKMVVGHLCASGNMRRCPNASMIEDMGVKFVPTGAHGLVKESDLDD